jgi:hypothetical protein
MVLDIAITDGIQDMGFVKLLWMGDLTIKFGWFGAHSKSRNGLGRLPRCVGCRKETLT